MNTSRTVKIQCIDERGLPSHVLPNFPVNILTRMSRKGADEQGYKIKRPSNIFEIRADCSVDIFNMIFSWMRANVDKDDIGKWSPLETARHALTIRQRAKFYEIAHYSLRLVFGTNKIREDLVKAIEGSHNFTAADIEFLKKTLKEDSNLVFKLDCAAARQFVRGEMHDDEVAKLQARTATTMEDTKMTNLVGQYIRDLQKAGQGVRVLRDRWQNSDRTAFPRIHQDRPAVRPAPTIAAPPAKNPWGARVPAVNRLSGTKSTPSLQKDSMGGSSTAMDPPKAFPSKLAPSPEHSPPPRPITMEFPPPERPELPQSGPPSPSKIELPQSHDTTAEETSTQTSGYLDSNESRSSQRQATQTRTIQAWQAGQQSQPSPNRAMTQDEWRTFTSDISIAGLEETLAHGSIHQADFDRFYDLYDDILSVEFWATYTFFNESSHVPIAKEYAYYKTESKLVYPHGDNDWLVYSAKLSVLDGFLRSVGGIGAPFANLDFKMQSWRWILSALVRAMKAGRAAKAKRA